MTSSDLKAGNTGTYDTLFKTITGLTKDSYFRLTVPSNGFTISLNPTCSFFAVHGFTPTGTLICTSFDNKIVFNGMTQDLSAGTFIGLRVAITNPTYTQTPDDFIVETLRGSTQYVYDQRFITGLEIAPGVINNIILGAHDSNLKVTKTKEMWLK